MRQGGGEKHHVLFISAAQVIYTCMVDSVPTGTVTRYIPASDSLHTMRTHIVDATIEIARSIKNSSNSLTIIYGSPWGTARLHESSLSKNEYKMPILDFLRKIFKGGPSDTVHGAVYPVDAGYYITAAHPVGYRVGDRIVPEIPHNKMIEPQVVHVIDYVDQRLHKAIIAALFPAYLQVQSFMVVSFAGLAVTHSARAGISSEEALLVIGARTMHTLATDHKNGGYRYQSSDVGFQYGLRTGMEYLYDALHTTLSQEHEQYFIDAYRTLLEYTFPQVRVTPRILVAYEPHPRALACAHLLSSVKTIQETYPKVIMGTDTSLDTWLRDVWRALIV